MQYIDYKTFSTEYPKMAEITLPYFDSKVEQMEFAIPERGVLAILKSGENYLYYWYNPATCKWQDHHMVKEKL